MSNKEKGIIGFVLSHEQVPVPELVELGAAAEQAGFDGVWASDHFQPWQDNQGHAGFAWITLAALSQRLSKAVVCTGITCPIYRYLPAIVAQGFASLAQLYPGRIFLGVGTGEAINEMAAGGGWGDYTERAGRLAEAVEIIRLLWSGEIVSYKGKYYQLENVKLYDVPPQPVPIYIAASGPKSLRLAGEHGDGLITDPGTATNPQTRRIFEEGARAAGKDPAGMPILTEHWVVMGDKEEAKRLAPLWRFAPKATKNYTDNPDPRDIQRKAEDEVPLEDVYSKWTVGTDPDEHAQAIRKLLDNGVTHVFIHSAQEDQRMIIDFFGKQVLPKLRSR